MRINPESFARASSRHPWRTVVAWLLVLGGAVGLVATGLFGDALTNAIDFTNEPEAKEAGQLVEDRLRGEEPDSELILVISETATVEDPTFSEYVAALQRAVQALGPDVVRNVGSYLTEDGPVSESGGAALMPVLMTETDEDALSDDAKLLDEAVTSVDGPEGFETHVAGPATLFNQFTEIIEEDIQKGEGIGSIVALIVLLVVLGAVVAGLIPLVLAAFAIVIAMGATALAGGAIFVVLIAVAASMTLLPAILSLLGDRVNKLRVRKNAGRVEAGTGFWDRATRLVMGRPVISLLVGAGHLAVLSIPFRGDIYEDASVQGIRDLREEYVPTAFEGTDARVLVGGETAFNVDFFDQSDTYMPIVFTFVLGLSFLLLTVVFRSVVLPVKAILMNLLSVGAAYGMVVMFFQQDVGPGFVKDIASALNFIQVESIEAWIPLFLFSILFGLSMDYPVFLLTRIREHYDLTGDNTGSVAYGLRTTAGIITGAALIMVAVFGGFAAGRLSPLQQMGFGLAVAVFLDATIVRTILVPSAMKLLGRANWYLPRWLEWLPKLDVEGHEPRSIGSRSRTRRPSWSRPAWTPRLAGASSDSGRRRRSR